MRITRWRLPLVSAVLALCVALGAAALAPAAGAGPRNDARHTAPRLVKLQLLAINDFHGALSQAYTLDGRPAGGAAILAAYLARQTAQAAHGGALTLRLAGGDCVGGSPAVSALLQDEPTIRALDLMHFTASTLGNHEFDEGVNELLRLQYGGPHPATGNFPGAAMRYLTANVVHSDTRRPLFKPYLVRMIGGVRVGIIGATLEGAPMLIPSSATRGLTFLDEAHTVNATVRKLRRQGIRAIIVLIHQGGSGSIDGGTPITGEIVPIVEALDDEVDVVITGHTHQAYRGTIDGKLVTQARTNGTAFADIDLVLDKCSGDVVRRRARIINTYADAPGIVPDRAVARLVARTEAQVAPIVTRVVGTATAPIVRTPNAAGESPLGDLITDGMRWSTGTDVAFLIPGGIRADLPAGEVTWGDLFTVLPFGNPLVTLRLTGAQLEQALEQQWAERPAPAVLALSGIRYRWNPAAAPGDRVQPADITVGGVPLDLGATYTVTLIEHMADGKDYFSAFTGGTDKAFGQLDTDVLSAYLGQLPQPFGPPVLDRIGVLP